MHTGMPPRPCYHTAREIVPPGVLLRPVTLISQKENFVRPFDFSIADSSANIIMLCCPRLGKAPDDPAALLKRERKRIHDQIEKGKKQTI